MTAPIPPDAAAAWARGDKVEAIRRLRQHTGLGLREAMQRLEAAAPQAQRDAAAERLGREAAESLARGDLGTTIERVRQAVALRRERHGRAHAAAPAPRTVVPAPRRDGLAPGEVPRQRVSVSGVLLVLAAAALLALLLRP